MHRSFFRSNEPAGSLRLSNHTNAEHYRTAGPSQRMDCSAPIENRLSVFPTAQRRITIHIRNQTRS